MVIGSLRLELFCDWPEYRARGIPAFLNTVHLLLLKRLVRSLRVISHFGFGFTTLDRKPYVLNIASDPKNAQLGAFIKFRRLFEGGYDYPLLIRDIY